MPRLLIAVAVFTSLCVASLALAAAPDAKAAGQANSVELFAGMARGDLEVKVIAKDDTEAQVLIKNTTKQPVSVQLPEAFAAVPVLAQVGGIGGVGGVGGGVGNNVNQGIGGGFGGGLGGGGIGGGGFGGGGFNIAPETVGKIKVPVVCLEHGKPDPNTRVPYQIKPIASFTDDVRVHELLKAFGAGQLNHRAAQAATWHLANGMSWAELAAKKIDRLRVADEPYFSPAELQLALRIAQEAERLAKARPTTPSPGDSE